MKWVYLLIAILTEVVATSALKASHSFTRLGPSLLTVAGYLVAFYCLSLTLREMPVGVAYAIWCGVGIVLVSPRCCSGRGSIWGRSSAWR